jgi:hypothetical protein
VTTDPACTCLSTAALVARGIRDRQTVLPACDLHDPAPTAPVALNDGAAMARLIGAGLRDGTSPTTDH